MKEMVGGCCVCSDESGWTENPLVYCDGQGCNVAVHQACYGIVTVPTGPWYCRKCESDERTSKVRCQICPSRDGAFKQTDRKGWAHVVCALYIPEIRFGDVATMEPILLELIPKERFGRTCYICEEIGRSSRATYGACMQCNKHGCKQQFHVTCAQQLGLLCEEAGNFQDNVRYCGYCELHYNKIMKTGQVKAVPPYKPIHSINSPSPESSPEKDIDNSIMSTSGTSSANTTFSSNSSGSVQQNQNNANMPSYSKKNSNTNNPTNNPQQATGSSNPLNSNNNKRNKSGNNNNNQNNNNQKQQSKSNNNNQPVAQQNKQKQFIQPNSANSSNLGLSSQTSKSSPSLNVIDKSNNKIVITTNTKSLGSNKNGGGNIITTSSSPSTSTLVASSNIEGFQTQAIGGGDNKHIAEGLDKKLTDSVLHDNNMVITKETHVIQGTGSPALSTSSSSSSQKGSTSKKRKANNSRTPTPNSTEDNKMLTMTTNQQQIVFGAGSNQTPTPTPPVGQTQNESPSPSGLNTPTFDARVNLDMSDKIKKVKTDHGSGANLLKINNTTMSVTNMQTNQKNLNLPPDRNSPQTRVMSTTSMNSSQQQSGFNSAGMTLHHQQRVNSGSLLVSIPNNNITSSSNVSSPNNSVNVVVSSQSSNLITSTPASNQTSNNNSFLQTSLEKSMESIKINSSVHSMSSQHSDNLLTTTMEIINSSLNESDNSNLKCLADVSSSSYLRVNEDMKLTIDSTPGDVNGDDVPAKRCRSAASGRGSTGKKRGGQIATNSLPGNNFSGKRSSNRSNSNNFNSSSNSSTIKGGAFSSVSQQSEPQHQQPLSHHSNLKVSPSPSPTPSADDPSTFIQNNPNRFSSKGVRKNMNGPFSNITNNSQEEEKDIKDEKDVKLFPNGMLYTTQMLGNHLNPKSSMAQDFQDELMKVAQEKDDELEETSSTIVGPQLYNKLNNSNKNNSTAGVSVLAGGATATPQSLDQLLERQWEQGSQFLMEQSQHFDIASLLSCLYQLRAENFRLEEHVNYLSTRRDHLLAVNARLAIPLTQMSGNNNNSNAVSTMSQNLSSLTITTTLASTSTQNVNTTSSVNYMNNNSMSGSNGHVENGLSEHYQKSNSQRSPSNTLRNSTGSMRNSSLNESSRKSNGPINVQHSNNSQNSSNHSFYSNNSQMQIITNQQQLHHHDDLRRGGGQTLGNSGSNNIMKTS